MSRTPDSRFEELQSRWAAGERLSAEEEATRLAEGARDPQDLRELEFFRELARHVASPDGAELDAPDARFVDRVLGEAGLRPPPRLRVVREDERPLPAPRPRRRALGVAAAVASAAALAAGIGIATQRNSREESAVSLAPVLATRAPPARAELVLVAGEVWLGEQRAAVGHGTLATGNRVRSEDGRACLTVDPGIDVCLGERSALVLESLEPSALRVRVERGLVVASLAPRRPGEHFSLLAGELAAEAVGTVFAVERELAGTRVFVAEGKVQVRDGVQAAKLVPAHAFVSEKTARVETMGRSEEARLRSLLAPRALWQTDRVATLEIAGTERGSLEIDGEEALPTPLSVFVPAGPRSVVVRDAKTGSSQRFELVLSTGERKRLELLAEPAKGAEALASDAPAPARAALPTASAEQLLEQARRELGKGNPKAALSTYRRLERAFPGAPEATTVLVTVGKLELDAGSPERALQSFERYLERGGPLAQEASAGRIRALRRLGKSDAERAAIEQYLGRYPQGFDASTLRQRLDRLRSPQ